MLTVKECIEKRRSIRKFKPEPVPRDLMDELLEAARLAPSATNRQPWRFQVITDPDLKRRIFEEATFSQHQIQEAPVIVVCGSELLTFVKGHALAPPGSEYYGAESESWDDIKAFIPDAQMNTAIATEHMVLMATALGLGTCWAGQLKAALLEYQPLREVMKLKDDNSIFFYPMMLGYPKFNYRLLPKRNPAKIKWI